MTLAQRKAHIELYILIALLILGAFLVSCIPAQTPKQATPIYVRDNQGVAAPHCAEGYSIKYHVLPADNPKNGYVVYSQPHTEPVCVAGDRTAADKPPKKAKLKTPSQEKPAPPKDCAKGEYRSMDGRCLHDQTGESRPSGDGCNSITCADPACRWAISTAMGCVHGDDPAPVTEDQRRITDDGNSFYVGELSHAANTSPTDPHALDPCGFPAALHVKDGRCHQSLSCEQIGASWFKGKVRATPKLVKGVQSLDCSWYPSTPTRTNPSSPEPKP